MQYKSSKSGDVLTGLQDYVSRMKESQNDIYYVAAESEELASSSPFVESLQKKDVEVLYFTEPIDEWCVSQLSDFDGKKLVDVTKEGLDVDEEDKEKVASAEAELKVCTARSPACSYRATSGPGQNACLLLFWQIDCKYWLNCSCSMRLRYSQCALWCSL